MCHFTHYSLSIASEKRTTRNTKNGTIVAARAVQRRNFSDCRPNTQNNSRFAWSIVLCPCICRVCVCACGSAGSRMNRHKIETEIERVRERGRGKKGKIYLDSFAVRAQIRFRIEQQRENMERAKKIRAKGKMPLPNKFKETRRAVDPVTASHRPNAAAFYQRKFIYLFTQYSLSLSLALAYCLACATQVQLH